MPRALAISLLWLAGCLDALAPDVGAIGAAATCNTDSDPDRATSFASDVSPILRRDCDRCHTPGGEGELSSGLDLSTYDSLRAGGTHSVGTIVIDRMPCQSVLW